MPTSSTAFSRARTPVPIELRELRASDRAPLERILRATGLFHDEEMAVALELIDHGLSGAREEPTSYRFRVAVQPEGRLLGYVCFGLAPLSDGVFDVYWLAVDPTQQGGGIGTVLLRVAEEEVARRGGRMLLIETGGKASYAQTRAFYEKHGYRELARIPDFFRIGDDKVIFGRAMGVRPSEARR
jgi:GNAT superfamily N-acetyltransferase